MSIANSENNYAAAIKLSDVSCAICAFVAHLTIFGIIFGYSTKLDGFVGLLCIGSIRLFAWPCGLIAEVLGYRPVAGLGTILFSLSLFLVSSIEEYAYYHLLFVFAVSLGSSMILIPVITVLGQTISQRRVYIIGISCSGSSLGVIIFYHLITYLTDKVGSEDCFKITSLVSFLLLGASVPFLDIPMPYITRDKPKKLFTFDFILLSVGGFLSSFSTLHFLRAIVTYKLDIEQHRQLFPLALVGFFLFHSLGCVSLTLLSNSFGPMNILVFSNFILGIIPLTLGRIHDSYAPLFYSISAIHIFFSELYWVLVPVVLAKYQSFNCSVTSTGLLFSLSCIPYFLGGIFGFYKYAGGPYYSSISFEPIMFGLPHVFAGLIFLALKGSLIPK